MKDARASSQGVLKVVVGVICNKAPPMYRLRWASRASRAFAKSACCAELSGRLLLLLLLQVFNELPLEFAAEVNELMNLKLEGSVG